MNWVLKDISEVMESTLVFEIRGNSIMLDEETEIATVWANDIHCEEQLENLCLMARAPEMFSMLKLCEEQFKQTGNEIMVRKINNLLSFIENCDQLDELEEDESK